MFSGLKLPAHFTFTPKQGIGEKWGWQHECSLQMSGLGTVPQQLEATCKAQPGSNPAGGSGSSMGMGKALQSRDTVRLNWGRTLSDRAWSHSAVHPRPEGEEGKGRKGQTLCCWKATGCGHGWVMKKGTETVVGEGSPKISIAGVEAG